MPTLEERVERLEQLVSNHHKAALNLVEAIRYHGDALKNIIDEIEVLKTEVPDYVPEEEINPESDDHYYG